MVVLGTRYFFLVPTQDFCTALQITNIQHTQLVSSKTAKYRHAHAHAAIKYRFTVLSLSPGAVITHITALHTQGPALLRLQGGDI